MWPDRADFTRGRADGDSGSKNEKSSFRMPVKPRINEARFASLNERLDKQLARIYLIWLVGIVVGAIHLRPEKVEYGGLSYIIESPEKLQGIIFVACTVY